MPAPAGGNPTVTDHKIVPPRLLCDRCKEAGEEVPVVRTIVRNVPWSHVGPPARKARYHFAQPSSRDQEKYEAWRRSRA